MPSLRKRIEGRSVRVGSGRTTYPQGIADTLLDSRVSPRLPLSVKTFPKTKSPAGYYHPSQPLLLQPALPRCRVTPQAAPNILNDTRLHGHYREGHLSRLSLLGQVPGCTNKPRDPQLNWGSLERGGDSGWHWPICTVSQTRSERLGFRTCFVKVIPSPIALQRVMHH